MKKLLIICALLIGAFSYGQNVVSNALSLKTLTSTQRDALNVTGRYPIIYNSTTSQFERYNGSAWVKTIAEEDLDTYSELNSLVADQTLTHNGLIDTFAEINAIVADKTLVNTVDTQTLTNKTINGASNTITNIGNSSISAGAINSNSVQDGTLDETDLDTSVNASLDLADSSVQDGDSPSFTISTATSYFRIGSSAGELDYTLSRNPTTDEINISVETGIATNSFSALYTLDNAGTPTDDTDLVDKAYADALVGTGSIGATELASTAVTPGSYTNTDITVDADGRITAASNGSGGSGESTTVSDSAELDFTLSTYDITASLIAASIDETKLDTSTNASLDLADSATQAADWDTSAEIAANTTDETGSGALVFADTPTLVTPELGSATATSINGVVLTSGSVNGVVTGTNTGDQTITLTGDVTGTGTGSFATTIAADAVDESMLNMFNPPTDEYYMKYSSTNGMTWALGSGGGDIYLHPYSDVSVDSLYIGTTDQIAARPLGTDVLSFATDATIELSDLTDVNTSTATNRNFLVVDGTDWESRAIVKADLPSVTYREAIAISDNTTALTTGTKMTWYSPPYAITITDAEASLLTAATGAGLIVDIHDDGTTIMSTDKLDIDVSEFHTKDAATQPSITSGSIAAGSKLEAIIDQIGSTVAGAGAIVYIYYTID